MLNFNSWESMNIMTAIAAMDQNANCQQGQKMVNDGQLAFTVKVR